MNSHCFCKQISISTAGYGYVASYITVVALASVTNFALHDIQSIRIIIRSLIIYIKKLLDSDWSRAVQLLCNSVQKYVISCNYNLKANYQSKCKNFYDKNECMSNCPCTHELSRCCHVLLFLIFSYILLTSNRTLYSFNVDLICTYVF